MAPIDDDDGVKSWKQFKIRKVVVCAADTTSMTQLDVNGDECVRVINFAKHYYLIRPGMSLVQGEDDTELRLCCDDCGADGCSCSPRTLVDLANQTAASTVSPSTRCGGHPSVEEEQKKGLQKKDDDDDDHDAVSDDDDDDDDDDAGSRRLEALNGARGAQPISDFYAEALNEGLIFGDALDKMLLEAAGDSSRPISDFYAEALKKGLIYADALDKMLLEQPMGGNGQRDEDGKYIGGQLSHGPDRDETDMNIVAVADYEEEQKKGLQKKGEGAVADDEESEARRKACALVGF